MSTCSFSPFIFLFLHLLLLPLHIAFANNATSYLPLENIALSCGTNSLEQVPYIGRIWTGDAGSEYVSSKTAETKSLVGKAPMINASVPDVPYMTARVFYSPFAYRFNVTPGPKFVRLHFYPTSYSGLDVSKAFVSVTAGNFTLMHNLSVSLTTEYINKAYLMKEFIIHVSGTTLELIFSPSSNTSDVYAFVNGIEVVSMPSNLYIQGDKAHIPLVGHYPLLYYIHNDSAMETMYRIDVGGDDIPAKDDTGMFRTWTGDDDNLFLPVAAVEPNDMVSPILYPETAPPYIAPELVYRTARSMTPFSDGRLNLNYNLSWFFPIDSGFNYLIRLHFCNVYRDVTLVNQVVFNIYLNNQTAVDRFDVIVFSGGPGIPVYLDFVVMVPKTSEGKQDLWVDLHPDVRSKPLYYTAFLNGVEIFKLSNWDGNLAGVNPISRKSESVVTAPHVAVSKKPKKITFIVIRCGISVVALGVSILFFLIVYVLKVEPKKVSWRNLLILIPGQVRRAHKSSFRHHFSMDEIRVATNNFDEALVIGIGGFGKVYKASFDGGSTFLAIKRSNPMSEQGALEFETEIQVLSQLRHHNLVSLLGHCQEDGEMILVYEYMSNSTLFDNLHLRSREQDLPLSWIQRLEICIGVARGLHYLHTSTEHKFIHRDIKTSNILLDHNWVAKVSDFGLSKATNSALVSTNVKGSVGYLDPEYLWRHKLTEKSDVYSFGVVLFEVVSARPAVNSVEDDEHGGNLADWALYCCENGITNQLVDPELEGKIATESFETYIEVAKKCLAEKGVDRPTMSDVLQRLVLAMQLQRNADIAPTRDAGNADLERNSDLTPGIEFSEIMIPIGR